MSRKSSARSSVAGSSSSKGAPKVSEKASGSFSGSIPAEWKEHLLSAYDEAWKASQNLVRRQLDLGRQVAERPGDMTIEQVRDLLPPRKVRGKVQPPYSVGRLSMMAAVWSEYVSEADVSVIALGKLRLDHLYHWRPSATKLPVKVVLDTVAAEDCPKQPPADSVAKGSPAAKAAVKRAKKQAGKPSASPKRGGKGSASPKKDEPQPDQPPSGDGQQPVYVSMETFRTLASLRDTSKKDFPRLEAVVTRFIDLAVAFAVGEANEDIGPALEALGRLPKATRQALRSLDS